MPATVAGAPAAGAPDNTAGQVGQGQGGAPTGAAGAGTGTGEGGAVTLVDSASVAVNSGRFAQVAMLGDLAVDGPMYTCTNDAVNHPEQHVGSCLISTCTNTGTPEDVGLGMPPSRGTMLLEGGPQDYAFPPDALGGVSDLFAGGEAMTLSAEAGTAVPAFSFAFTAPPPATLSAPAWVNHPTAMTVSTAADMTVTWSPVANAELVVVVLSASNPDGNDYRISITLECSFPMAAGTASVPAALLQALPTDTPAPYSFSIFAQHHDAQVVDGFPIDLTVRRELRAGNIYTSNGNVTLQ